jgi:hypothetical protein
MPSNKTLVVGVLQVIIPLSASVTSEQRPIGEEPFTDTIKLLTEKKSPGTTKKERVSGWVSVRHVFSLTL